MEQTLPANVTNHYRRNRDQYDRISARLFKTQKRFLEASRNEQITMLQKSHSFAVISVQTPVDIHESAFTQLWSNDVITPDRATEALSSVNYKNNKVDYIMHSLHNEDMWFDVCEMLESGQIDNAHKYILDNFKGVGPAKAPFVLSMLGFQEKMCIDTNIVNAFDLDGHATTVVVEKYDNLCQSIRDKMPTMRDMTTPFMFQWITFDYQRGEISMHETFYDIL
jgi:thermostable 8-oxoguanine DNA glycosylase